MTDRLEIQNQQDIDLKKALEKIDLTIDYGTVTMQVRAGKVTMVKIERTIKLD